MEDFGPVTFLDKLNSPAGLRDYIHKCFDLLDASDYFPEAVAADRLDMDELILPLFATKYTVDENGEYTIN